MQAILREAANRVARIITPTEAIKSEVHEQLNVELDRIAAIPEAAKACFFPDNSQEAFLARKRLGVGEKFVLYVGTVEPRKNLLTLVQAFEKAVKILGDSSLQLVIAGRKGWLIDDLFGYVERSPSAGQIKFTGYLSDDELRALYSACDVFVYPSLYEGFGLPPLEAMACGAPVIASRIPSIMEVLGDAAQLVSPTDVEGLTDRAVRLLLNDDERRELSARGLERAGQLSWTRTAELTRAVYEEALAS
jgi:glycosyltransferase involved in cell wall biosynthesis